ncbi:WD40 repeat domain-containing protein [Moorena producens JHB]|uniref:WD40 repeat domain-containing protein n=1 Tax=Moorena producens (strain JHB) TaxID=1454205 RepID=A0A1D9FX77_MOOP1|nr:WD40 repeat domain-containing protein [Moorena producens]AOY79923.1 WD40 repeat domain-containing protein [Moorena producens JHB]
MTNLRNWLSQKSPEEIEHFLGEIPRLWLEGGKVNNLSRLLSNYEFIEAKITHPEFGIKALIEDYQLIDNIDVYHPDYSEQTIKSLKLIQGALRLSTHILSQDPNQLPGQLSGRLLDCDPPDIQRLLQQIPQTNTTCLRSLRATLNPPTGRLLSTLIGHGDSVNAVAVTPDDTMVISGSSDHTVKVWDLNTGTEIRTLTGHSAPVNSVAVTPDGTRVISGASDHTVRVWNLATGKEILRFNGHSAPVNAVAVTPDGKKVVSVSIAKYDSIKVWDVETGKEELTLKGHGYLVRTVAITFDNRVISASDNGTIKIWSLTNGEMLFSIKHRDEVGSGSVQTVYAMVVTRDYKWLIYGYCHSDQSTNKIIIRNLKTLRQVFTLDGHNNLITALAVTPDRKQVISGSFLNTIKIWDIKSQEEILTFIAHDDSIYDIKLTRNGNQIISASKDKTIKVWNLESQEKHVELVKNKILVHDVKITPDGKQAICALQDHLIKIFNLEKLTIVYSFDGNHNYQDNFVMKIRKILKKNIFYICQNSYNYLNYRYRNINNKKNVSAVAFSSYGKNKKISKYSKYSDAIMKQFQYFERSKNIGVAITVNKLLVFINNEIASFDPGHFFTVYHFFNVCNYKKINSICDFISISQYLYISLLLFISVVCQLLIIIDDIILYILRYPNFSLIVFLLSLLDKLLYSLIPFIFNDSATTLSITPDGNYVIAGSTNSTIKVWHLQTKKLHFVLKGHQEEITSLAVTPDGKYLVSGSKDKTIKIWNLETRKECFTLTGHGDSVNTLSVTPDGNYVVSGSKDKTIKIWDLEKREEIFTFTGHTDSINRIKITSNGKLVISASSDKTLQVWDFETREVIATFTGESAINCCAVAPDDVTIVAGDEGGNMHFLRLEGVGSRE